MKTTRSDELFADWNRNHQLLIGCAVNSASPRVTELAGRIGFDAIWIEMEHASADLWTAEALCLAAAAGAAIPLVRTASTQRDHILRALEIGGRIIVVPLVNDAATAREVVRHGKFRPLGERGFNIRSRGMNYGLDPQELMRANEKNCILPQIETVQAAKNVEEILAVKGIGGIFIGPGDLSSDLGRPAKFEDPELIDLSVDCLRKARQRGLHAAILTGEGPLLDAALAAGADLCIIASDLTPLVATWRGQLQKFKKAVSAATGEQLEP